MWCQSVNTSQLEAHKLEPLFGVYSVYDTLPKTGTGHWEDNTQIGKD